VGGINSIVIVVEAAILYPEDSLNQNPTWVIDEEVAHGRENCCGADTKYVRNNQPEWTADRATMKWQKLGQWQQW
jgi:hypothetical protein